MKNALIKALILLLCTVMLSTAVLGETMSGRDPGLTRISETASFSTFSQLAEKYEFIKERYSAADGKPLNAYMITDQGCMVGISGSGMYKVEDKGISEMTEYLTGLADIITETSKGTICFVSDPDHADILIKVNQRFLSKGNYISGSKVVKGYASEVTVKAFMLSNQYHSYVVTRTNAPGQTVSVNGSGSGNFWMKPPRFRDTEEMKDLVHAMMAWYGFERKNGSSSSLVRSARQALIDRGYLQADPGAVFDDAMEAAVRLLQANYGLEETGVIDRPTLLALYYDRATVEQNLKDYPAD